MDLKQITRRRTKLVAVLCALAIAAGTCQAFGQEAEFSNGYVLPSAAEMIRRHHDELASGRVLWRAQQPDDELQPRPIEPQREPTRARGFLLGRTGPSPRLSRVPAMFGDFFGGGSLMVGIQPPSMIITQTFFDGAPVNFFVQNANMMPGANPDPNVPIIVFDTFPQGPIIANSIGPGMDLDSTMDRQPDTYPIDEPAGLRPPPPGPGRIEYVDGKAVFVEPATGSTDPAPGSVGQGENWALMTRHRFTPDPITVVLPPGGGTSTRRVKIAENNSPEPRDRCYFTYNFFNDVVGGVGDVNRYVFGCERTFLGGTGSIDVRFPFAMTIDHDQMASGVIARDTEFGNITTTLKMVLRETDTWLMSFGCGVGAPTAGDSSLRLPGGPTILHMENESVHLLPFVAFMASPRDRCFFQSFVQLDVDTNGNSVRGGLPGGPSGPLGTWQDQTLLFVDASLGCFLYENPDALHVLAAVPMLEVHYATTLQNADVVSGNGLTVGSFANRFDVVNLTTGVTLFCRNMLSIRPAFVVPISTGDNRQFDYEAGVNVEVLR